MIDALRGFALTGVCLGNLALFSFYFCLSDEQKAELPFPLINSIISYFIYFFVDWKFWTLFSIMFGFGQVVVANLGNIKIYSFYVWFLLIAALGRFMTGYWIGQSGRMYHIENYFDFFRKTMRICTWIGFPVMFIMTLTRILTDAEVLTPRPKWETITCFSEIASLAIGIFYAIKFAFLYQNKKWKKRLCIFKEMGRMALTNYLMQTLINLLIFNGIGLGLAGRIGPSIYILWFIFLVILQIGLSKWWLSKYMFGPFEWLWRSLTFKKVQPVKIEAT